MTADAGSAEGGPTGSPIDAPAVARWLRAFADLVHEQRDTLTELDSAIGDADHGLNLDRGVTAIEAQLDTVRPSATRCGSSCRPA